MSKIILAIMVIGGAYALCKLWLDMMQSHKIIKGMDSETARLMKGRR